MNKNRIILSFEKKNPQVLQLKNICTEFGTDSNIFRLRDDDTCYCYVTHRKVAVSHKIQKKSYITQKT